MGLVLYKQHGYLYSAVQTTLTNTRVPRLSLPGVASVLPCSRPCSRSCPVRSILLRLC